MEGSFIFTDTKVGTTDARARWRETQFHARFWAAAGGEPAIGSPRNGSPPRLPMMPSFATETPPSGLSWRSSAIIRPTS